MNKSGRRLASSFALGAISLVIASCAGQQPPSRTTGVRDGHFTLHLVPGPAYEFTSSWFIFPVKIYPQVACWIETPQGSYIDTIYATAKSARKTWRAAPPEGRPEALPVWSHLSKAQNGAVDGISGATPSGITARDSALAAVLPRGTYVVKLEVNRSYDYNESYTRANSGVNGQPSLIYECAIVVGEGPSKGVFEPVGKGSIDGSDGEIRPGLKGITTALQLLDSAEISYDEGASK
jgi:hypothetical protein